jgi:uncharacterized protein YdhG (YjbR/CyaY superfamily)
MNEIEKYISHFPEDVQKILNEIRIHVKTTAPQAVESISYKLISYKFKGKPLVYFGAFKNHIGFYATPTGHEEFAKELSAYKHGKGSVQFPLDKPIPYQLIKDIVAFRLIENS